MDYVSISERLARMQSLRQLLIKERQVRDASQTSINVMTEEYERLAHDQFMSDNGYRFVTKAGCLTEDDCNRLCTIASSIC